MRKLVLILFLSAFAMLQAQKKPAVPTAMLGKWIAVDSLHPDIQNGIRPTAKTKGKSFNLSRTWAVCEFYPSDSCIIDITEHHPDGEKSYFCDVLELRKDRIALLCQNGQSPDTLNTEPEDYDFFYVKPNYYAIVVETDMWWFKLKDTVYFQRAEPRWRE